MDDPVNVFLARIIVLFIMGYAIALSISLAESRRGKIILGISMGLIIVFLLFATLS